MNVRLSRSTNETLCTVVAMAQQRATHDYCQHLLLGPVMHRVFTECDRIDRAVQVRQHQAQLDLLRLQVTRLETQLHNAHMELGMIDSQARASPLQKGKVGSAVSISKPMPMMLTSAFAATGAAAATSTGGTMHSHLRDGEYSGELEDEFVVTFPL